MPDIFQGFHLPEQNWFKMPNEWTDLTANMTLAEMRVVEYILKHTWGYHEYGVKKKITTDEFVNGRKRKDGTRIDRGTGLDEKSVRTGLRKAVEDGFVIEEVDDRDRARVKKYYSIRMRGNHIFDEDTDIKGPEKGGGEDFPPGGEIFPPRGEKFPYRTEKDTLERNSEIKNKNNNSGEPPGGNVVVALGKKGIGKKMAQEMASRHSEPYIFEKIDFLEYLLETDSDKVKKPSGWLRRAIEDGYGQPDGYSKDWRDRKKAEETVRKEREASQASLVSFKADEDMKREKLHQAQLERLRTHYGTNEGIQNEWAKVVDRLTITNQAEAKMFLPSAELLSLDENKAVIWVTTMWQRERVENMFGTAIKRLLAKTLGISRSDIELQFILPEDETPG